MANNKSIIVRDFIDIYVKWSRNKGETEVNWYGTPQRKINVSRLLIGNLTIVPSTAEEVTNSKNNTKIYDNFTSMIFTGIDLNNNYIDLENPQIITLGFSNYTNNETFFRYNIHFISLNKNIKSQEMIYSVNIKYILKI